MEMRETGSVQFNGTLNPTAREFRPRNHIPVQPLRQVYYSFVSPYPLPPINEVQVELFGNGGCLFYPQIPVILPGYINPSESEPMVEPITSSSPTRSLLLSSVPNDVSESMVWKALEVFGDVRWVQMERLRDHGILIVHFFDLRHAHKAFRELTNLHWQRRRNYPPPPPSCRGLIGGCSVWVQFIIPASNSVPDGINQGTIIISNLDSDVSSFTLKQIFERFGAVKELRETPMNKKKNQKFIEFFDIRDAAKALNQMNGKQIQGKPIVIEFSRPGSHGRNFNCQEPSPPWSSKFAGDPHRPFYSRSQQQFIPKKQHYVSRRSLNYTDEHISKKIISGQEEPRPRIIGSPRKNHILKKSCDSRFLISEDTMDEESQYSRDSRTTLMIKNIPNKYSLKLLLEMLDKHCINCNKQIIEDSKDLPLSSYDFLYLPVDFRNKCNVGYGFVNMTSPQGAWRFYKAFHLHRWELFNSRKICQVTYARVQGLEALKEHFKKSRFPISEMEEYELPVVFSPPRDGIQLTEPLVVVGNI